jgi:hypothetical protein
MTCNNCKMPLYSSFIIIAIDRQYHFCNERCARDYKNKIIYPYNLREAFEEVLDETI